MSVSITAKQRQELNGAIAIYLKENGFQGSFDAFTSEASIDASTLLDGLSSLLERKFVANARLQMRVTQLEKQLQQLQEEKQSEAPSRDKRKPEEWIPRPPERFKLEGHRMSVCRVIFHPVYSLVVTASDDTTIRCWDILTGACERALTGHTNSVNDLAFNKKGDRLISCSSDMTAKIWDFTAEFVCLKTLRGHDHTITSVAFVNDEQVLTASRDALVKLWDIESQRCIFSFSGHEKWVRMIRVHHDQPFFASCGNDDAIKVWCLTSKAVKVDLQGHSHVIECLAWAPDEVAKHLGMNAAALQNGNSHDEVISGKPMVLASGGRDKTINVYHVNAGVLLFSLEGHANWIRALAFHPAGKFLMSVSDDKMMFTWSMESRSEIKKIVAHNQFINSVAFHRTQPYVATGSADSTTKIWECR